MRTLTPLLTLGLFITVVLAGCSADMPTAADDGVSSRAVDLAANAHLSNSKADLAGSQDGHAITGKAVVNFTKNADNAWRANVSLQGDLADGTYDFFLTLDGADAALMCSFTLSGNGGRQGCSSDENVGGFNGAEVRDTAGDVVASGTFERRGGGRNN